MSNEVIPQEATGGGEAISKQKTPAKSWLMLVVVYFASFMAPIAQFKLPPLASWLIPAFGMDGLTFGYLMSAISVVGLILAFPAAFIARRFGLKSCMILSLVCLACGTLLGVISPSFVMLAIGRLIEGAGIGLLSVTAPSCISIWFPDSTRGKALGIWATWMPVGILLMFNTAPSIAEALGWETVFWFCIGITLVALVLFALVYKVPENSENAEEEDNSTFSEGLSHLKNGRLWILGIVFFAFNFIQLGVINSFYNTYLETAMGYSAVAAASLTSIITVISLFSIPICGAISDRLQFGRRKYWIGASFIGFFIAFLFAWDTSENATLFMYIFFVLAALSSGLCAAIIRPTVPLLVGNKAVSVTMGMGVLAFTQNFAGTVGPPIFGWGYDTLGWQMASNTIVLPICVVAFIISMFITGKVVKNSKNNK